MATDESYLPTCRDPFLHNCTFAKIAYEDEVHCRDRKFLSPQNIGHRLVAGENSTNCPCIPYNRGHFPVQSNYCTSADDPLVLLLPCFARDIVTAY